MRTYNFNKTLKNLQGEDWMEQKANGSVSTILLAEKMSQVLIGKSTDNFAKTIPWALELSKSGIINIDKADRDFIKDLLKRDTSLIDYVKYFLDEVLDNPEPLKPRIVPVKDEGDIPSGNV